MAKETKYIYLEKTKQRVPIRAKKGFYHWKIGYDFFEISAELERVLIYAVNINYPEFNFFEWSRLNLPQEITAKTNPELLHSTFLADHPAEDLTEYNYSMIQLYANPKDGMWLYGDGKTWSFWITAEDEKELLTMLNSNSSWQSYKDYLYMVANRYSMSLNDELISQALKSFFIQHGLDPDARKKWSKQNSKEISDHSAWLKANEDDGTVIAAIIAIILAISIIITWLVMFSKNEISIILLPLFTLGFMLAGDIYLSNNRRSSGFAVFYFIFMIANLITSFVGLATDWEWSLMDNEVASGINIFVPAIYGMLKGGGRRFR